MKVKNSMTNENGIAEIYLFDELSGTYISGADEEPVWKEFLRRGSFIVVAISLTVVFLICYFVALILEAKILSLISLVLMAISLVVLELWFLVLTLKQVSWENRKNWLLSGFRKNLLADHERMAIVRNYSESTRESLAARLISKIEVEDSRLNLLVGASRKLGIFPALAAVYAAYLSVFPEDIGVAFDSSSGIKEQLIAKLGIFSMAAIVGIYIGVCAAEAAIVRVKSIILSLDVSDGTKTVKPNGVHGADS